MKRKPFKFNSWKIIITCLTALISFPICTSAQETAVFERQDFISNQKTQMDQGIGPDDYEDDDTFSQANVVQLVDPSVCQLIDPSIAELIDCSPQNRNFHDAGDQDWVKFYGIEDEPYEVKVSNVGVNCDVAVNIYDTDGTTLLRDANWGFEGESELLSWRCPKDGIYYVMIQHFGSVVVGFGENATYDLAVYRPIMTIPGFIVGTVTDAITGTAIADAVIVTDGGGSAISLPNGSYLMVERAGTYTMTVIVSNVVATSYSGIVVDEGGITTRDIELQYPSEFESAIYFPHIASDSKWETEICMINTGSQENLSGELTAYNNSGQEIDSKPIFLGPNVRKEMIVGSEFSNPSHIGHIIFESDSENVRGYTKFYIDGKYRVAIPAASDVNTGDIYISHIASDSNWTTGISILNTTSSPKDLNLEFDNGTAKIVNIAAHEHKAFTISGLFDDKPQSGINSAVIKNGSGIVGLEIFGSTASSGANYLSGILLKDDTATNIYFPHVASDSIWGTGIVAYNPSGTPCNLTITPYTENGAPLSVQTQPLNGQEKYIGTPADLSLPDGTAWFSIEASSPITGFELFSTKDGNQLGGYTGVGISGTDGVFPKIEKDGGTGIAFVNIEDSQAIVTMTAYDIDGSVIATETVNLNAHEKVVDVPSNLFSQDITTATYIAYSSTGNVVGFQLNVSSDGMMLDALPGM